MLTQQDLEYAKLFKKTGDPYYLPENYKKRHDEEFKKHPLHKYPEVTISQQIDWQNQEKSKEIILRTVTVADPNPFITPQELLGKWKRELEKMMVEVGWTLADDIYPEPVKIRKGKKPLQWYIFLVMRKSLASNKNAFFGAKAYNLKTLVQAKEHQDRVRRYLQAKRLKG